VIQLDAVGVQRRHLRILQEIDLTVGDEVIALVGPSGSGKTTLLRVLLGFDAPTTGRVSIDGRVMSHDGRVDVLPEERNIAMVFQDLALWPHFSVHGNLAFGLERRGLTRAAREERIARVLSWVGLDGKAARHPDELSGGERQRVAIARALVLEPAALLLDEPLGSLDVALKDELCDVFARLFAERGLPVLYVTHDPREAARVASRMVVLEGGRIVQRGTFATLAEAPRTPFVRAFVRAARSTDA
jgi:ABC-type Fe3+/spermidine/putrescine transport system ATPase subunit